MIQEKLLPHINTLPFRFFTRISFFGKDCFTATLTDDPFLCPIFLPWGFRQKILLVSKELWVVNIFLVLNFYWKYLCLNRNSGWRCVWWYRNRKNSRIIYKIGRRKDNWELLPNRNRCPIEGRCEICRGCDTSQVVTKLLPTAQTFASESLTPLEKSLTVIITLPLAKYILHICTVICIVWKYQALKGCDRILQHVFKEWFTNDQSSRGS